MMLRSTARSRNILRPLFNSTATCLVIILLLLSCLVFPLFLWPFSLDESMTEGNGFPVVPFIETPPIIDGQLNEAIWSKALKFDDFKTFKPDFGKEGSQKTTAYLTYDAENIYFAFRAYDSETSKVKASLSRRDAIDADDLAVFLLDPFNDMQGAYMFMLNPYGIQADGWFNPQGNGDVSLDFVWFSKGQIDDEGWSVEARIPLSSLRFPNKKITVMRVVFARFITRTSEQLSCPPLQPDKGSPLMQATAVTFSGLHYRRVAELLPAFTFGNLYQTREGRLVKTEEHRDISLTGKLGLTSDLVFDGTYNPDFSQVEADAGQIDVNLRYQLYFPEKRPFFMEGSELWNFGGQLEDAPVQAIVYTRTIVSPDFAFKLAGKISRKDAMAALYARDNLPGDEVEEHPDFTIIRYKHSLSGDSYLGAYYTGKEAKGGFNRVTGADGIFRLSGTSTLSFHLFGSFSREREQAELQNGHSLTVDYTYSDRKWVLELGYQEVSPYFRVDTGFILRTGLRRLSSLAMYQIYPQQSFVQKIEPFYWNYQLYDTASKKWESINVFALRFFLPRSSMVRFDAVLGNEIFSGASFRRNTIGFQAYSQIFKQLFLQIWFRHGGAIYYKPEAPYQGYGNRAQAGLEFQPISQLSFSLSLAYADFYRRADKEKIYDYTIIRSRNTFQINKYLFLRLIIEYNFYYRRLTADSLISFTYIPGTVFYIGYGSAMEKLGWNGQEYVDSNHFHQTKRGFFCKLSYLWRF